MKGRKDYTDFIARCKQNGNEPIIRLLSCDTGNINNTGNCFAQLLANELGVKVKAPTDLLFVNPDGTFYIGGYANKEMNMFYPRK